jgi:tetratricopeptide (TPR) repeat protein
MPEITETTLGFPLNGTLRRSPFPKIVRQLARIKSTGSLYLLNGKTKKVVFFNRGEPISVRSNVTAECLGQVLAREGLITQAQCDQTLESIRRTGKKQGELLVEMGILSEGNLRYGLEAQLRHKLYDIFSWDDGRYQYKPDVQGDDYGLRMSSHAQGLIVDALLETADEAHAKQSLEPFKDRFPLVDSSNTKLEVTPEEDYFLSCLDGSQSIGELLSTPSDPAPPSTVLLLYAAIQAGIAKLAKSRRQPRERPPRPTDGRTRPDSQLTPNYKANRSVTSYEDTPLPGQLPKAPDVHLDTDDDFGEDVPEPAQPVLPAPREISSLLVAAERDVPDETFADDDVLATGDAEPKLDEASSDDDDEAEGRRERGQPLVADSADSGVFERVLLDDDDDQPFDSDAVDEAATVSLDAVTSELDAATVQVDAVREPTTLLPPEPEPEPELPPSQLATLGADDADEEDADEIEELEELEEVEELEELEDEPVAEGTDPLASAPAVAAPENADDLAALAADLEVDDDLAMADLDAAAAASLGASPDLMGLDELDDLEREGEGELGDELDDLGDLDNIDMGDMSDMGDLADDVDLAGEDDSEFDPEATAEADAETAGALQFGDGESAMAEGRWDVAIAHLEAAYELGLDIAELHTYLAWARFQASGQSPDMAAHALELLYYAEDMNPNLGIIYAYRSAVLLSQGDHAGAQDAAQRALDLDPYDELAIDVMDKLV